MSEVKVNKLTPRTNCGTVTLGDSGDSFTIPAGVTITNNGTQTGFGRTGAVDWQTGSIKTATFTATSGEGYFCNTTGGAFTLNLPSSPSAGAIVAVSDYAKTFNSNNLTIGRGGSNIEGSASDLVLDAQGLAMTFVYVDSTKGWKVTGAGRESDATDITFISATGGTISCDGNCKVHTFTGPGTFTVNCAASTPANNVISYVVVGGGGSGGFDVGGGGGAGGFREYKSPVTPYTASPLNGNPGGTAITVTAQAYPITVGAGAPGPLNPSSPPSPMGISGSNSTFSTVTSAGGGGGGGWAGSSNPNPGLNGGSGGGSAGWDSPSNGGSGNTPPTTPSQGNNGGSNPGAVGYSGGSGGGAGAVGANAVTGPLTSPNTVTAGVASSITGSPVTYSRGGNGGNDQTPGPSTHIAAANTGDGGGGAGNFPTSPGATGTGANNGGNLGGSGIVIIRYKFQ
jgi:hypothetical protein